MGGDSSAVAAQLSSNVVSGANIYTDDVFSSSGTVNHMPTGTVTISDTSPEQGQTLTVANTLADANGLGVISYQWNAAGINIGTGNSYTVSLNEVGKTISVIASYTDNLGQAENVSSASTSIVPAPLSAGFTISPVTQQATGENGATASYSIQLNTAPLINQDVVITFTSSDTSEGVINNPTLTFTSTNYAIPQTLTVQGVDDYLDDGDIPYQVTAKVGTTDVFYKSLTINPLSLTNTDDSLDKALDLYGDEGGSKIDVLNGGNGADKLHGLNMADDLSGGLGNDSLWGGYGDDNLHGNEGDDELNGEQENDLMENRMPRVVVLNSVARGVIEQVRGRHPEYVFTYKDHRVTAMNNSGWQKARKRVGLTQVRIHDLKHTFGRRLRAANVSFEDRQDLLGHKSNRITDHYSSAEIANLIEAAEKACVNGSRKIHATKN